MSKISIDCREIEQLDLLCIAGTIDFASIGQLAAVLTERLCEARRDVLLDLSEVSVLDARAISKLQRLAAAAAEVGTRLQVIGAKDVVLEVLQITGAAKALGVYETPVQYAEFDESRSRTSEFVPRALVHLACLPADNPLRRELRDRIITDLLPLATQLARRFRNRGEHWEDLIQVAVLALINAVDRYDPDRGRFLPFAVATIIGELKRHLRDRTWMVRPPRRLQELSLEVRWAEGQLGQLLRRSPTSRDIADYLDVPVNTVNEAMAAYQSRRSASLTASGGASDKSLLDTLGAADRGLDSTEFWVSLRSVIADLPVRTRRIMQMRFANEMTQSEIAQAVGLSQMHISRILATTLAHLRRALEDDGQTPSAPRRLHAAKRTRVRGRSAR